MEHQPHEAFTLATFLEDPRTWVAAAFLLFFILFGKKLFGAMGRALDSRSLRIASDLREAQTLREEAEELLADYRRKYHESMGEAETILTRAREDADRMARDAQAELHANLAMRTRMAEQKIAQAGKQALQQVRERMADIVADAARTLITQDMRQIASDELIRAATAGVERGALH